MKALEQYQTHRVNLEKELKDFVNGMNTPAIVALADKINHMCLYLGDPFSVTEMLKSICKDIVKKWGGEDGKKPLGVCNKKEAYVENKQNPAIIIGHFKWNYGKAYLLTDQERSYIKKFYFANTEIKPTLVANNEYEQQAIDFLNKTNTQFSLKFNKNDKYFADDKEGRNIYTICLKRGKIKYEFSFGQSIVNTEKSIDPKPYDVLAAITKHDVGTFENFCDDFGYDKDSRKAEKIYNACVKEYEAVERLFGDILEELQEIQ